MSEHKILFVDDEEQILNGFKRNLRKEFTFEVTTEPNDVLKIIEEKGPFSLIVSDYKMPEINGVELLTKVKEKYPEMIRVLLTGQADMQSVIDGINKGSVFRFISKPCDKEDLVEILNACLKQYDLLKIEKDLLEQTLKGSINVLLDVLSLARSDIFSKASRIKQYIVKAYEDLGLERFWAVELAAMFYFIGAITLPEELIKKLNYGEEFTEEEKEMFNDSRNMRESLLKNIPRLSFVVDIINKTEQDYSLFQNLPVDLKKYEKNDIAAHILKVAIGFERLMSLNPNDSNEQIIKKLREKEGIYNPGLFPIFNKISISIGNGKTCKININQLTLSMTIIEDVKNDQGAILVVKDQEVTEPLLLSLRNLSKQGRVVEPIEVRIDSK